MNRRDLPYLCLAGCGAGALRTASADLGRPLFPHGAAGGLAWADPHPRMELPQRENARQSGTPAVDAPVLPDQEGARMLPPVGSGG